MGFRSLQGGARAAARSAGWCLIVIMALSATAEAKLLQVGPNGKFQQPCEAITAAKSGDVIEIDAAGNYDGDVCAWRTNNLTIRGVGGRAKIDAAGRQVHGKGIWAIYGEGTVVENMEFSGARVRDRNGAGIRFDTGSLTVRNCFFHDNENGILGGRGKTGEVLIEYSEFANNGHGDGYSHNIYINHVARFTFRYCYSRDARIGHLVKSRAAQNFILYNRLVTGDGGRSSMEIDIPNGGTTYIIGNTIFQSPSGENDALLMYGMEGPHPDNPGQDLYVVNNTFVNKKRPGRFILVGARMRAEAVVKNNIFAGPGEVINQPGAMMEGNFTGDPGFAGASAHDFRLKTSSPAIDMGVDPGTSNGVSLVPNRHYVHPLGSEPRRIEGKVDAGAYELGAGSQPSATSVNPGPPVPEPITAALECHPINDWFRPECRSQFHSPQAAR